MKNRLKCAWNCLRGRPTMYRMDVAGGVTFQPTLRNALIVDNSFRG